MDRIAACPGCLALQCRILYGTSRAARLAVAERRCWRLPHLFAPPLESCAPSASRRFMAARFPVRSSACCHCSSAGWLRLRLSRRVRCLHRRQRHKWDRKFLTSRWPIPAATKCRSISCWARPSSSTSASANNATGQEYSAAAIERRNAAQSRVAGLLSWLLVTILQPRVTRHPEKPERV